MQKKIITMLEQDYTQTGNTVLKKEITKLLKDPNFRSLITALGVNEIVAAKLSNMGRCYRLRRAFLEEQTPHQESHLLNAINISISINNLDLFTQDNGQNFLAIIREYLKKQNYHLVAIDGSSIGDTSPEFNFVITSNDNYESFRKVDATWLRPIDELFSK